MSTDEIDERYPLLEALSGREVERSGGSEQERQRSSRAQGCLLGQLAGDALGSQVEFMRLSEIHRRFPGGVRELVDGGTHSTIAGQPTDDSELALMLARSIVRRGGYEPAEAAVSYALWLGSSPFDVGGTTRQALQPALAAWRRDETGAAVADAARRAASEHSQANGALMRVSPLGIFAHSLPPQAVAHLARADAGLTHPHQVCVDANAVFVVAIARAVGRGTGPTETYASAREWAEDARISSPVRTWLQEAEAEPPVDFESQQGWVRIAFQNALWQLLHAPSLEEGVCDTVMRGGDTDTNAAIAGALLGAVHGAEAVPARWRETVLSCRPKAGRSGVVHPRPMAFWPVDALQLAQRLTQLGGAQGN